MELGRSSFNIVVFLVREYSKKRQKAVAFAHETLSAS